KALESWLGGLPAVILMDLDGTLIDSAADIALALNRALDDLALPPVSERQVRDWVGRGAGRLVEVVLQHVVPHHGDDRQRHALQEQLLARF
ncbi:HAD hydrolase-like protein, partial [Acinetobacter baumannii]